jgi:hypothetical protein
MHSQKILSILLKKLLRTSTSADDPTNFFTKAVCDPENCSERRLRHVWAWATLRKSAKNEKESLKRNSDAALGTIYPVNVSEKQAETGSVTFRIRSYG